MPACHCSSLAGQAVSGAAAAASTRPRSNACHIHDLLRRGQANSRRAARGRVIAHVGGLPGSFPGPPGAGGPGGDDVSGGGSPTMVTTKADALREMANQRMRDTLADIDAQLAGAAPGGADGSGPDGAASAREAIEKAIGALQVGLIERDTEVRLLLLAAVCGEHLLLIGPPGTAKSELGRRLSRACQGGYFERLLTRFSVPEELFGPLSMRALEQDQYIRQVDGYLPSATVAFVDEIFKANSAILNTLLTILNERLFDNGSDRIKVPLMCLVGASNELPESEELDALYDRFLIRRQVAQVSAAGLTTLLSEPPVEAPTPSGNGASSTAALDPERLVEVRAAALKEVTVPRDVVELVADLRQFLQDKCEPPVYVSDRRLVKAVAMLRVAAYANGRTSVSKYDCLLLQHVLWQRPEEADKIYEFVLSQCTETGDTQQVRYLLSAIFSRACRILAQQPPGEGADVAIFQKREALRSVLEETVQVRQVLTDKLLAIGSSASGSLPVVRDNLWLGEDEAAAVASALRPMMDKASGSIQELLYHAVTLETLFLHGAGEIEVDGFDDGGAPQKRTELQALDLAGTLPQYWHEFIREAPKEDVKPHGTTPMSKRPPKPYTP